MPAEAQALAETSSVVSSTKTTRYLGVTFLVAGFEAGVAGAGVVAGVVTAGVAVELGVPTSVGVLAVSGVASFLLLRVATIAQTMPATKMAKAILNMIRTVLDMHFSISKLFLLSSLPVARIVTIAS